MLMKSAQLTELPQNKKESQNNIAQLYWKGPLTYYYQPETKVKFF